MGRSRSTTGVGYRGTIPEGVWDVLTAAWEAPLYIESNMARELRHLVAFAASMGWLSIIAPDGRSFYRQWRVTAEGLVALNDRPT